MYLVSMMGSFYHIFASSFLVKLFTVFLAFSHSYFYSFTSAPFEQRALSVPHHLAQESALFASEALEDWTIRSSYTLLIWISIIASIEHI